MNNRREFITLIGSAAAWPLAVRAQQSAKVEWLISSRAKFGVTVTTVLRNPPFDTIPSSP